MPNKTRKGDPLVSPGSVGYVKKVKNERGDQRVSDKRKKNPDQDKTLSGVPAHRLEGKLTQTETPSK